MPRFLFMTEGSLETSKVFIDKGEGFQEMPVSNAFISMNKGEHGYLDVELGVDFETDGFVETRRFRLKQKDKE